MRPFKMILFLLLLLSPVRGLADELPSWNETPVKQAILEYLATVTTPDSEEFIPLPERIAVFDNDGTFWCERPSNPSTRFQTWLLGKLVAQGRVDGQARPYRAWLQDDRQALRKYGWKESYRRMNAAFAGMPVTAFRDSVEVFMAQARHEDYQVPFTSLYYQPMLELARLLRENGFQIWVVSGSEQDFLRTFLEDATGVPPQRAIGSWTPAVASEQNGKVSIVRGTDQVYNGHEAKAANIETRIGRRPVFCVGNSNNDEVMCRYAVTGPRLGMALWVHHDDPRREYEYDRGTDRMSALVGEKKSAWAISMSQDWQRLYKLDLKRP